MADLIVSFKEDVPAARRDEVLKDVGAWIGVKTAAPLKRDASSTAFRRFSFVHVDDAHADHVTNALRKLPEIEAVEVPPRRGLAGG
jgi:hypothetical protein